MKKFLSGLCATTLAATFAATSIVPVSAAPIFVPKAASAQSDVITVDQKIWKKGKNWNNNGNWNDNRTWNDKNRIRTSNSNFRRKGDSAWYNGHRGYNYHRRGYHEYNGFWFPAGAFIAGAVIGGAIANSNNNYSGGSSHVAWCYDRYRSYRDYDNTFQPYNGPRQPCYSPYS